jgi:Flp pilus assembly protein TadB
MFIPLGLFVLLAVLMHVPLVSMYLVAAGLLITVHQLQRLKREQRIIQPGQILQFLLAFRGEYFLQPAPFASLSRAMSKTDEPLKSLLNVMVQTYFLTSSPERAFAELRNRTDNAYLNQFAYILEMSESASADSVVKAVDNLVERLRTHDELRREIKANLSSITSQTSILQAVAIGVLLIVAIVPSLHRAYISIGAQIFYITFMTIMLASSYYIEREIDKLAERVT